MNKIHQMIKELRVGGVEVKTLGEVAKLEKGKQLNKELLAKSGKYPAYNGGTSYSGFTDNYNCNENTIIISQGGASAGFVNFIETKFYANAHCYIVLPNPEIVANKYVYHFLKLNQAKLTGKQHGAGIPALRAAEITNFPIPLPPLPVQQAIAGILDTFTELQAELQARKLQYEYYRGKLLTNEKWEVKTLGEVCEVITGGEAPQNSVPEPDETNKYAIWANGAEVYGYTNRYKIDKDCCTISSIGANTGTVYFREACFTPIIRLKVLVPKSNDVIPKYLFHFLSSIKIHSKKSSVPNLNAADVKKLRLPVPPLSEQLRIVSILDKFDKLVNSLSEGLPAEIKMRQQQYEYYREKLLAFN